MKKEKCCWGKLVVLEIEEAAGNDIFFFDFPLIVAFHFHHTQSESSWTIFIKSIKYFDFEASSRLL